jgi:hypothetical protein
MNNLADIYKKRLDYREGKTNDDIAIKCINCDDHKYHLGVSFKLKAFNCFRCGFKGHLNKLTKLLFNITLDSIVTDSNKLNIKTIKQIDKKPVLLPEDFISLSKNLNSYYNKYHEYLFNRRVSLMQIDFYNLGISLSKYKGYIYIPIYDINGNQVYWTTRSINKDAELKSILPKVQDGYYIKSDCLFNIHNAVNYDEVCITEGVFNSISIGKNSVAIMGKYLSDNQLKILSQCQFKRYTIALDNDAKKEMYDIADKLRLYSENVYITKYPDDRDINKLWQDDELHKLRFVEYKGLRE